MADAARANAALIERFCSAFARSDVETMLSCYRPEVVFRGPVLGVPTGLRSAIRARAAKAPATRMAANP